MGAFKESLSLEKMMKILFILVVLTCLALGEDFSAEDKTDVAVAPGGDLLHHSLVKRDAAKKKKKRGGLRKKRKGRPAKRRSNGKRVTKTGKGGTGKEGQKRKNFKKKKLEN